MQGLCLKGQVPRTGETLAGSRQGKELVNVAAVRADRT